MVVKQLVARLTPPRDPPTQPVSFRPVASNCRLSRNKRKRSGSMFTRTVEVTTKSGKARDLATLINDKVLPILKKQIGFADVTLLASDTEPNRVVAISFWNTKEDAERYHREQYPVIQQMIRPLLDTEPMVRTFNVDSSTTHKIAAEKAA
jgi:heme-degrading monooxygenase HmoA